VLSSGLRLHCLLPPPPLLLLLAVAAVLLPRQLLQGDWTRPHLQLCLGQLQTHKVQDTATS
jgi:hypothetical protein